MGCGNISTMKLKRGVKGGVLVLSLVVGVGVVAGFVVGQIVRVSEKESSAASANIMVVDNDQLVVKDQTNDVLVLEQQSTVVVRDVEAIHGYTLSAKLAEYSTVSGTVTIAPSSTLPEGVSSPCSISPCALDPGVVQAIIITDKATNVVDGDMFIFSVVVTIPAGAATSDYFLDIEYFEEANPPLLVDPGTTHGAMQLLTNDDCPAEQYQTAFDARNGQIYYVRKIAGLCWMESNLRYAGGGDYHSSWGWSIDDRKNIILGETDDNTVPYYYDPGGSADYTDVSPGEEGVSDTYGFYGYLYNWCATMGGQTGNGACINLDETMPDVGISICPAGWRLPTGGVGGEFVDLNDEVNDGDLLSHAGLLANFFAVYSGDYFLGKLINQGKSGSIWSSTINGVQYAYDFRIDLNGSHPTGGGASRITGLAVRCVR